ncbi:hypothetical protein HT746_25360 [Burkholderia pyrrocinia]|uniref:hypothetical protein n=1 Tax=Burkholderia pyrrocinia TaxID=60550 RepID=UPI0015750224|nr:hypothetical protein [Burkholderia pyrrocinia]NTX30403.1 hypothetical protein [Burkholderia pyrrocinia]
MPTSFFSYLQSVVDGSLASRGIVAQADDQIASAGLLGEAQLFSYAGSEAADGIGQLAALDRGGMMACDIISSECKGTVLREFPGQYLNSPLNKIQDDANDGVKAARKALKLLNDNRFKK